MNPLWEQYGKYKIAQNLFFSFPFFYLPLCFLKLEVIFPYILLGKFFVCLFLNWRLKIANYITVKVTAQRPTIPRDWTLSGHLWSIRSEKYHGNLNTMNLRQNTVIFSSISDPSLHPFIFFEQNENSVHHVAQNNRKSFYEKIYSTELFFRYMQM